MGLIILYFSLGRSAIAMLVMLGAALVAGLVLFVILLFVALDKFDALNAQ